MHFFVNNSKILVSEMSKSPLCADHGMFCLFCSFGTEWVRRCFKLKIYELAKEVNPYVVEMRRYFHEHPEMKLIIAPHEIHREHLLSIEAMLKRPSVRLSEAHEDDLADKDCLIIDSFGLLSSIYRYGQIAYIGGGFGAGIHNTLEAAVYGMPVLFGPRYHKFKEAKDLIAVGGGFSITDDSSFRTKMDELLTDPTALETSGQAAGDFVKNSVGATDQILRQIHIR